MSPALQSITGRLCIVSAPAGHHRTTLYCLRHCRASQDDSVLSQLLRASQDDSVLSQLLQDITGRLRIVSSPAEHHRTTLYCLRHCRTSQDGSVLSPVLQSITGRLCIVSAPAEHHRTTLYCLQSCRRSQDDSVLSPVLQGITGVLCAAPVVLLSFSCRPSEIRTAANWSTTGCKVRSENVTFRLILIFLYLEMKK